MIEGESESVGIFPNAISDAYDSNLLDEEEIDYSDDDEDDGY